MCARELNMSYNHIIVHIYIIIYLYIYIYIIHMLPALSLSLSLSVGLDCAEPSRRRCSITLSHVQEMPTKTGWKASEALGARSPWYHIEGPPRYGQHGFTRGSWQKAIAACQGWANLGWLARKLQDFSDTRGFGQPVQHAYNIMD